MRRTMLFSALLVLCSAVVLGQTYDEEFFLQKHQVRKELREARREKRAGLPCVQSIPAPGQEDFDVTFYEIDITIDPSTETITGTVTMRANSETTQLTQAILNLFNDMVVTSVSGNASGYLHTENLITIDLDRAYGIGEQFQVSIDYNGRPVEYNGLGFHFRTHGGHPAISNDSYPYFARSWWPCKDDPADKADSVNMFFTVPNELTVVCNGVQRSVTENPDNTKTFYWHEGYPISTYLVAIAAADYVTFSDMYYPETGDPMEILYYVFPVDLNNAMEDFNIDVEAMEYYVSIYGEYPFIEEKYGIAECASAFAGMEYQTITFYGSPFITGTHEYDYIIVHELSHMWWGDMVTNENWHNTWLNEGFATYSEALYFEHIGGSDAYHQYMDVTLNSLGFTNPIYRYDTSDPFGILAGEVYDKGAWVLHMLRGIFGYETFLDILAEYRAQYEFETVTTEAFQAVCEQVSGQDLSWFFQQWIYEPWHPEYYWGWQVESIVGSDYVIQGFIDQIQEYGPIFTMPLDIAIVTVGGDTLYETVFADEQYEIFQLTVSEEPAELLLDPYNWVLKEAQGVFSPVVNYVDHGIQDDGDGNGRLDPGETVELTVEVVNTGVNAFELSATLGTDDPDITITNATVNYGEVGHNEIAENPQTPFVFIVDPAAETHLTKLYFTFSTPMGYSGIDSFYVTIGTPTVLLVDDDGGDDYESVYQKVLAANAVPFQMWNVSRKQAPGDTLHDFDIVVWSTGHTRENTLTTDDQNWLSSYLDDGGRLFISGQDIGYDLVQMGNGPDFFTNYLHAEFIEDVSPEGFIQGVSVDPITESLGLLLVSQTLQSPDVIAPITGANATLLYSPSRAAAGIKYSGDYRLVYFAVGLEGIDVITGDVDPVRETLMSNIVQWLQLVPTKGDVNEDGAINILDVVWVINIILGSIDPGPSQYWSADFDDNGSVDVLDAIKIVNEILGPVGTKMLHDDDDTKTRIPIEIETDEPLAGVQLNVTFDPEQCTPSKPLSMREGIEAAASIRENEMNILLYSLDGTPIPEIGTLAEIPLIILDDQPSNQNLQLQESILAGVDGKEISGKVTLSRSKGLSALPKGFELFQNVPNPFNPETEIRFGIPSGYEDGLSVVLTVYNLLGQRVRTLVHGNLEAGYYTVRWDGLNNEGNPVASGLYFYLLETSYFKAMKRMVLLK